MFFEVFDVFDVLVGHEVAITAKFSNPEVLGRFLGRLQEQDPSKGHLDGPEVKLIQDGLHQAFDQSLGQ